MSEFGLSIKRWRKNRGFSQLELSLQANISSKHISFLENGRSKPSREMVIQLANALEIPLGERNILLSLSGFAEAYSRMKIEQAEMESVRYALGLMLNNHAPYPAVVLDWDWNIIMANAPQQKLTDLLIQYQPNFPKTNNVMELLFDPNGYRPFIKNWQEIACLLLQRLQLERRMHQDRRSDLIDKLLAYPDVPTSWKYTPVVTNSAPMIHLELVIGELKLKMFSTLASFGTAIDITMQELTIEQYFAVDEITKDFFENQLVQL